MKIRTWHEYPPLPDRRFDTTSAVSLSPTLGDAAPYHSWGAVDDDSYDMGAPIGWGATEQEAIADLLEQLKDE